MDDELKVLIPEDKFLKVGKTKFKIWISAERSLKATVLFNKLSMKGTEERKSILTDYDFYVSMLDVAFLLIRQDFRLLNAFDWLKRQLLTKKYILKHMDIKELNDFINDALEPIIGTKKKEMESQLIMAELLMKMSGTVGLDRLAELLLNSLQGADTKKAM